MTASRSPVGGNAPAFQPVDGILAAYNAAMVPVWIGLGSKSTAALGFGAAHAAAALLPWILGRVRPIPASIRSVLVVYPAIALAVFWGELGALQALRNLPPHDDLIRRLDLALFGVHWQDVWMIAMPQAWLSELMHFGYFLYYLLLVIPPVAVLLLRGRDAFRSVALAVMVTYLSCFLIYLAFPVYGPRAMAGGELVSAPAGLFHTLVEGARDAGDSLGTAFPSSHVAGAVTMAWVAWRWLPRAWALAISAAALMVTFSTVYTRNHYAVDALAGLLWVLPLQAWLVPRLERSRPGPGPTHATPAAPAARSVTPAGRDTAPATPPEVSSASSS
jgi:membrane-associated phospholipid phosphatase